MKGARRSGGSRITRIPIAQQQTALPDFRENMWSGQGADAQHNSFDSDDANIISDVLGHTVYPDGLAPEENINLALEEMQAALAAMSATEKVVIFEAQRSNPQLFDDDHVLQFLWAENFNAPVSKYRGCSRGSGSNSSVFANRPPNTSHSLQPPPHHRLPPEGWSGIGMIDISYFGPKSFVCR